MVRLLFGLFFNLRPALPFPLPDFVFVPLQGAAHGTLTAPAQPPQNPPCLGGVILDSALVFAQMSLPPPSPQAGLVAHPFRSPLESLLDAPQALGVQTRPAP